MAGPKPAAFCRLCASHAHQHSRSINKGCTALVRTPPLLLTVGTAQHTHTHVVRPAPPRALGPSEPATMALRASKYEHVCFGFGRGAVGSRRSLLGPHWFGKAVHVLAMVAMVAQLGRVAAGDAAAGSVLANATTCCMAGSSCPAGYTRVRNSTGAAPAGLGANSTCHICSRTGEFGNATHATRICPETATTGAWTRLCPRVPAVVFGALLRDSCGALLR